MSDSDTSSTIAIGLGSNLGDRRRLLESGLRAVDARPDTSIDAVSSLYQTEPRIVEEQPPFLNAAATLSEAAPPGKLLEAMKTIERDHGRERSNDNGPRRLDLDLLLWRDRCLDAPDLTVPHPGLADRAFVLIPLAELAPDALDPRSGRTIRQLLEDCSDDGDVERVDW